MKYLTNSGLSYFLNKIKTYLTSSTYLNSIGISNSEIDDIADDAGYSSGSLPASEDVFLTGDIIPNTDNSVDLGASSKNIKMIYTKGITINGTQFLPSDYIPKAGSNQISGDLIPSTDGTVNLGSSSKKFASLNGIAPDELGLPTSTYTDVSSYITHFDSMPNAFTAPVSGLLFIGGNNQNIRDCAIFNDTKGYAINELYAYNNIRGFTPVEKGDSISVYISGSINSFSAKIFHLKGKV